MLSRAWFRDGVAELGEEELFEDYYTSEHMYRMNVIWEFREEEYEGESLHIKNALQEIKREPSNNEERTDNQRKKRQVRKFFLKDNLL